MVTNMTTYPINSMVLGKVPSADDRQTLGIGGGAGSMPDASVQPPPLRCDNL